MGGGGLVEVGWVGGGEWRWVGGGGLGGWRWIEGLVSWCFEKRPRGVGGGGEVTLCELL